MGGRILGGDLYTLSSHTHRPVPGCAHIQVTTHPFTQQMFIECPLHTGPVLPLERRINKPDVKGTQNLGREMDK